RPLRGTGHLRLLHQPAHLRHHRPAGTGPGQTGADRQPADRVGVPGPDGPADGRPGRAAAGGVPGGGRTAGGARRDTAVLRGRGRRPARHHRGGSIVTTTPTVGFIYPDHAAEDDYPLAASWLEADFPVAHIYGTDLHAVPELLDLGSPARLAEGARLLAETDPAAVVWACTSGSFVYGPQGAEEQVSALAEVAGVPASSTSRAYLAALSALGVQKVAVAASYPDDVARLFI